MSKNLWVVGDSTLSSFEDKYYLPRYGYGTKLQEYLDDEIIVKNIALSGRSSKSYTTEPEYQTLLSGMKKDDYLIIGFGHNDEKTENDRYTQGEGDYLTQGTFAFSLYNNYIKKAQEAGCTPILCTPIVRRSPDGKWNGQMLHVTAPVGEYKGGDYPKAIRDLARQLNIALVDMTMMTKEVYDRLGADETLYLHAWPSDKAISVDNTHTNVWGARVNAYLCLSEIKNIGVEGLSDHITGLENDAPMPSKKKYFKPSETYKPTVFDSNLSDSKIWEKSGIWKPSVFGDIMDMPTKDTFTLEALSDNSFHIAVCGNAGKISAVSDGIAVYYTKVPVKDDFIFSASMKINNYFLNDQVSFGLMVRDDMYIDKVTPDILGDYVAAAPLLLTHENAPANCFARKSGKLVYGGTCTRGYKPGETVKVQIESTSDGYACTFGDETTITGGFDFKLTALDPENVYLCMFAARNADVTFSDVRLDTK